MALEDFLWRGFGPGDDESVLPQDLRDRVTALDLNQKQELLKSPRLLIAREFLRDPVDGGMPACPHCDSTRVAGKGKNGDGSQRWLCKLCDRTFSASASSVLALSKLPEETWPAHAEGMAEGKTPGQLAEMCEVSLKTSRHVRMRPCEAMGAHLPEFRSGPGVNVEVDGTMRRESLEGNNSKGGSEMPRDGHESGKSPHVRGVSGHQCRVLCAVNDLGDVCAPTEPSPGSTSRSTRSSGAGRAWPRTTSPPTTPSSRSWAAGTRPGPRSRRPERRASAWRTPCT